MPNTKSAARAMRQSQRRRVINQRTKDKFKSAIKELRKAIAAADKSKTPEQLSKAFAMLDKAVKKGVIHKNTASRRKSRLEKAVSKMK